MFLVYFISSSQKDFTSSDVILLKDFEGFDEAFFTFRFSMVKVPLPMSGFRP